MDRPIIIIVAAVSVTGCARDDSLPAAGARDVAVFVPDARVDGGAFTDAADGLDARTVIDAGQSSERPLFTDVTSTNLPNTLSGFSMDARPADVDGDGDLDVVLAVEFRVNILLLNQGDGRFVDARARLPQTQRDSEDVVIHDFDGDDDLDLFFASEDDQANELFLNEGGTFIDASDRISVTGVSNAAVLDTSTEPATLLLGNAGQNAAIQWSAAVGRFVDVTDEVLPTRIDQTQDLELADVDDDGDLDLAVGNEDASVILLREGRRFEQVIALPADSETREIDVFDADGDGDLDVALGNIRFVRRRPRANRLLLQTAPLVFEDRSDETNETGAPRLAADDDDTFDIDAIDIDVDGDVDLVTANLDSLSGTPANAPYRVYLNDGRGFFTEAPDVLPETAVGNGFDIEAADFDGDGKADLYLASRGGPDRLLLAR